MYNPISPLKETLASGETKPYAYTCEYCDRQFCDKTGLSKHVKQHTSEKTFFCDECDSSFFEKRDLSRHKASHLNKKTPEFKIEWRYKSVQASSITVGKNIIATIKMRNNFCYPLKMVIFPILLPI